MLPKVINLGPLTLHLYGLIIASAIFVGWYLAKKRSHVSRIPQTIFDDPILIIPLALAIIGARAYHVADYWEIYSKNLPSIFAIQNGGLGIWGSLVGILAGFWIVAKIKKLDLLSILDLAAPSILLGQSIGRFGNFINQEAFGPPTNLPWGVFISPENRPVQFLSSSHFHPTFFYEAILDFAFFALLIYLSHLSFAHPPHLSFPRKRESTSQLSGFSIPSVPLRVNKLRMTVANLQKPGQMFALYLILYSTGRFIAEFWRIDTATVGEIKVAHILSSLAFFLGLWLFLKFKKA